jgi:hypothetical protein
MAHQFVSSALTTNTSISPVAISGRVVCAAVGTWGGGTLQFKYSPNEGTTWIDITSGSLTADGAFEVAVGVGGMLKATLAGASSPSLTVSFSRIP